MILACKFPCLSNFSEVFKSSPLVVSNVPPLTADDWLVLKAAEITRLVLSGNPFEILVLDLLEPLCWGRKQGISFYYFCVFCVHSIIDSWKHFIKDCACFKKMPYYYLHHDNRYNDFSSRISIGASINSFFHIAFIVFYDWSEALKWEFYFRNIHSSDVAKRFSRRLIPWL